jgi:hypothetical protein
MFIALQIPIIDGRRFDSSDQSRLLKPSWAGPRDVGREFLRSMGPVRERRAGAVDQWLSEGIYCGAARWLKFPVSGVTDLNVGTRRVASCSPVFRRWMGDGRLVFRLEVGWRVRLQEQLTDGSFSLEQLIRSFLAAQVLVCTPPARKLVRLFDLPQKAFDAYRSSSTRWQTKPGPNATAMIRQGQVLLFLELLAGEFNEGLMGKGWKRVLTDPELAAGFNVSTARIPAGGQSMIVYCVHRSGALGEDPSALRSLRVNLLRMHAETEGLDELVRWHGDPDLSVVLRNNSDLVNEHLEVAMKRLRPDRGSSAETPGFRIARKALEVGSNGRIDVVLEEIQLRTTAPSAKLRGIIHALHKAPGVQNLEIDMSTNKTENTSNISGNISGSSISTAQGGASSTVTSTATLNIQGAREALAEIEKAVAQTVAHVKDDEQKRDLEMRLKDLKKEGKDRKWYEVSAEGLMDAAKAVGAIAGPIVTATTAFLKVLG